MRLWRFELKKLLYNQKGILILLVCLLLKALVFTSLPEMKDERIKLSQKQYDKYLHQLYGENTPEKSAFIISEYMECKELQDMSKKMQQDYSAGFISDEQWEDYSKKLNEACLHENAAKIFSEKAEQFMFLDSRLPPPHYIYEYGWQTIFSLQLFPDAFFLFGILLLTAQCFSMEAAGGMLPILLSAKNGKRQLFFAKLLALLTICSVFALLNGLLETTVFYLRGFMNDSGVPLYSISLFAKESPLQVTLLQGYILSFLVRSITAIAFCILFFGVSIWLRNSMHLIFAGVCTLLVPLLFSASTFLLFTHTGLLSGSRMLQLLGKSGFSVSIPLGTVFFYSLLILPPALHHLSRGSAS